MLFFISSTASHLLCYVYIIACYSDAVNDKISISTQQSDSYFVVVFIHYCSIMFSTESVMTLTLLLRLST